MCISLLYPQGKSRTDGLLSFPVRTLSEFQVQDWITFYILWPEGSYLGNGWLFTTLEPLTISVTFFCASPPQAFSLDCPEIGDLGGKRGAYQPARRARAFPGNVMTYSSILAGTSLLTLRAVLARGTKILTAEGLTCDKGHHYLSNHTTLMFTDTTAHRALK